MFLYYGVHFDPTGCGVLQPHAKSPSHRRHDPIEIPTELNGRDPPLAFAISVGYPFRMTRRRFILAACAVVVALGATWWLSAERLTAEEQRLVGTWRLTPDPIEGHGIWTLKADHTYDLRRWSSRIGQLGYDASGRWNLRGGAIVLEGEPDAIRRVVQRLLSVAGLPHDAPWVVTFELATADEMVNVSLDGSRQTWIRDRGD